jgi:hypothetical protein
MGRGTLLPLLCADVNQLYQIIQLSYESKALLCTGIGIFVNSLWVASLCWHATSVQ